MKVQEQKNQGKKFRGKMVFFLALLTWSLIFFLDRDAFLRAWAVLRSFLCEMMQVMPFVLVLSALLTEWVPSKTVKKHLGEDSDWRGALFGYLLGSLSAGPIYAAFPVCQSLREKGASVRNLTILISTWAVIKVPMLFMELKSLGPAFTGLRYILTLPSIFIIGTLVDRLVGRDEMRGDLDRDIALTLPGKNCGACGVSSCAALREKFGDNPSALTEHCVFL